MWFQQKKYDVICIGSASKDIFFPTDEALLLETPEDVTAQRKIAFELGGKYRVKDRFEAVGGVAANVSCGLARFGYRVASYSCIGKDEIGRYVFDAFRAEGVATEFLTEYSDTKTDLSAIVVMTQNGERTIFHNRDANERLVVRKESLKRADWLFVSALNGEWRKNLDTILEAKAAYGMQLALNPGQHNIKEDASKMLSMLPFVDVLLLNKDEAIELLQADDSTTNDELNDEWYLMKKLSLHGAKSIGMTDGKRGAWGYDGQEFWFCPIYTKNGVVDSTGAGDAFGSGFMAAHVAGKTLSESLCAGIANSGSVVGFYGAIEGLLHEQDMTELLPLITPERLR